MKLTKYEHACLTLEKNGEVLVIDPGNITDDFTVPTGVVGIVVTHEHPDHFDAEKLHAIIAKNPNAQIIAPSSVTSKLTDIPTITASVGTEYNAGPFTLEFFGGKHQIIHKSLPIIDNLGVMVNDTVYYPGDSYTLPNRPVEVLAVPTSGPWLRIGDTADFVRAIKPKQAFSTHDAHSSHKNEELVDYLLPLLINDESITYQRLREPLEIDG